MENLHAITSGIYSDYTLWGLYTDFKLAEKTIILLSKNNPSEPFHLETFKANEAKINGTEIEYKEGELIKE